MRKPPKNPEFDRFYAALKTVLSVSPEEMQRRIEAQKETGKRLPKGSASLDPAVAAKLRSAFED